MLSRFTNSFSLWARRNWWKVAVLSCSGWVAFYAAFIAPAILGRHQEIAHQKATGLGAVAGYDNPLQLWSSPAWSDAFLLRRETAFQRGPRHRPMALPMQAAMGDILPLRNAPSEDSGKKLDGRKIVRNSTLDLEVKNPAESAEKIRVLAEGFGGYLVTSEVGEQPASSGGMTIRVPAKRFEEARTAIRQLATRVYSEKTDASDVTTDYVDREARLRNLHAQELQYVSILKSAKTIKDTLDVSEKLNGVREEIDKQQAEFETLSRQVETVAITVTLTAEADTRVLGMHWRPWQAIKVSSRDGLESLGSYTSTVTAALFQLPTALLWLATFVLVLVVAVRAIRWIWRKFFAPLVASADKQLQS